MVRKGVGLWTLLGGSYESRSKRMTPSDAWLNGRGEKGRARDPDRKGFRRKRTMRILLNHGGQFAGTCRKKCSFFIKHRRNIPW